MKPDIYSNVTQPIQNSGRTVAEMRDFSIRHGFKAMDGKLDGINILS